MFIFQNIEQVNDYLHSEKTNNKSIGFIPTMGALHKGHISLIQKAKNENDTVVCSIFVNPLQFNDKEDFNKYPRHIENDIQYLESFNCCDAVFIPSEKEIYPDTESKKININLNNLDKVFEGAKRPGHFHGVVVVVNRLFNIIKPHKAYFGEKDLQQVAVIKQLVKQLNHNIEIVVCPIVRDEKGLALSSRNTLLSASGKEKALLIYKSLNHALNLSKTKTVNEIKQIINNIFEEYKEQNIKLDYFDFVNPDTFETVDNLNHNNNIHAIIAAYIEKIRLIDNIKIR